LFGRHNPVKEKGWEKMAARRDLLLDAHGFPSSFPSASMDSGERENGLLEIKKGGGF
jgi:hypothetical protein